MSAKAEALRPFDLTVAQYGAMLSLYYVPGQSPSQLARAVAVTPQTIGATLDKLAAKSLVTRKPSKLHRKVLVVTLTSKGERLLIEADAAARTVEERIGRAFSADGARAAVRSAAARGRGSRRIGSSGQCSHPQI